MLIENINSFHRIRTVEINFSIYNVCIHSKATINETRSKGRLPCQLVQPSAFSLDVNEDIA